MPRRAGKKTRNRPRPAKKVPGPFAKKTKSVAGKGFPADAGRAETKNGNRETRRPGQGKPGAGRRVCGTIETGPGERKEGKTIATTVYGYIRVSSKDQNEDRQRIALREMAVPEKNIYLDKRSGRDFDRPQYRKLLRRIKKDDLLYIKSIDRLGRNYAEILEQWRVLTKEKGVDIVVLDMPLLDTRCGKDLIGTFIADIVLQLLSFVAENERANIRQRQAEGIAAARARGVRFGRPPKPLPENFPAVYRRWKAGQITGKAAAAACGMPLATFRYRVELYEKTLLS